MPKIKPEQVGELAQAISEWQATVSEERKSKQRKFSQHFLSVYQTVIVCKLWPMTNAIKDSVATSEL